MLKLLLANKTVDHHVSKMIKIAEDLRIHAEAKHFEADALHQSASDARTEATRAQRIHSRFQDLLS